MNNFADNPITHAAFRYAEAAHKRVGQLRKGSGLDYIHHPVQVAEFVQQSVHNDPVTIAVALLHDVLEDTLAPEQTVDQGSEELARFFLAEGIDRDVVRDIICGTLEVTDVSRPEDGNRRVRKALDRDHAGNATPERKTVKLADIKSNFPSIVLHKPGFNFKWVAEKAEVHPLLKEGDPALFAEVGAMIAAFDARTYVPFDCGYPIV